jgi:hypothetical protein
MTVYTVRRQQEYQKRKAILGFAKVAFQEAGMEELYAKSTLAGERQAGGTMSPSLKRRKAQTDGEDEEEYVDQSNAK